MSWFAFDIPAYEADTAHLTTLEHGAYFLLIKHYMSTRLPLLNDDLALAGVARVTPKQWKFMSRKLRAFFIKRGNKLHQKRCDAELDKQDDLANERSEHAKKASHSRKSYINKHNLSQLDLGDVYEINRDDLKPISNDLPDKTRQDKKETRYRKKEPLLIDINSVKKERTELGLQNSANLLAIDTEFRMIFWPKYPTHPDRKHALKAFHKAREKTSLETIMAGLDRYLIILREPNAPKPKYAQGWLNGERWEDEDVLLVNGHAKGNGHATGPATGIAEGFASAIARRNQERETHLDPAKLLLDRK